MVIQLSEVFPQIRTIRYLGSKRKLVDRICRTISDGVDTGSTILDMFAGTNSISYGLSRSFRVFSNDVQAFSYIIARTLLLNSDRVSASDAKMDLEQTYRTNYETLAKLYRNLLTKEKILLNQPLEKFKEYATFCSSFPQAVNTKNSFAQIDDSTNRMSQFIKASFPFDLFTTYFSNAYFGLEQCLQIDSLRYAIDMLPTQKRHRRDLYLCALIYSIDSCVASPGHFAQFFTSHSKESFGNIIKERRKSIIMTFYALVDYFRKNLSKPSFKHEAWCTDYVNLFNPSSEFYSKMKEVDLIYADPPYTADHYSRFYHVLETLVKYDYPSKELKGRYRIDRFASKFSMKSKAYAEFEKLLSAVSLHGCKLLISYNNDGLVSSEQLIDLSNRYFDRVSYDKIEYNHSNQGRKTFECQKRTNPRKEYLVCCEN